MLSRLYSVSIWAWGQWIFWFVSGIFFFFVWAVSFPTTSSSLDWFALGSCPIVLWRLISVLKISIPIKKKNTGLYFSATCYRRHRREKRHEARFFEAGKWSKPAQEVQITMCVQTMASRQAVMAHKPWNGYSYKECQCRTGRTSTWTRSSVNSTVTDTQCGSGMCTNSPQTPQAEQ